MGASECSRVFYIFSTKTEGRKQIVNSDVISDIRMEIERLRGDG